MGQPVARSSPVHGDDSGGANIGCRPWAVDCLLHLIGFPGGALGGGARHHLPWEASSPDQAPIRGDDKFGVRLSGPY